MSDYPHSKVGATVVSLSMLLSMVPTPALAQAVEEDKAIIDQMADQLFGDEAETVSSNEEPVQEELVNSDDVSSDNAEVSETSGEVDAYDGGTDAESPDSRAHDISLASVRAWILGLNDGTAYIAPESGFQAPTFTLSLDGEELPDDAWELTGWKDSDGVLLNGLPTAGGMYWAVFEGRGEYEGSVECELSVYDYSDLSLSSMYADGYTVENGVLASGSVRLSWYVDMFDVQYPAEGTDYTLEWRDKDNNPLNGEPTCAGSYILAAIGTGNYHGEKTVDVVVSNVGDISGASGWAEPAYILPEEGLRMPTFDITLGSDTLSEDDYEFVGWETEDGVAMTGAPTEGGDYLAVLEGRGEYSGTCKIYVSINDFTDFSNDGVSGGVIQDSFYLKDGVLTGGNINFEFNFEDHHRKLVEGTDFTVTWLDSDGELKGSPTVPGLYTLKCTGIGNFHGERTIDDVRILAANDLSRAHVDYSGAMILPGVGFVSPTFTLRFDDEQADTITYEFVGWKNEAGELINGNPTESGRYYAVLEGRDDFTGTCDVSIVVRDYSNLAVDPMYGPSINASVAFCIKDGKLSGSGLKLTWNLENERVALTEGVDYTVSWLDSHGNELEGTPSQAGSYTIVVTGIGDYHGERRIQTTISDAYDISNARVTYSDGAYIVTGVGFCDLVLDLSVGGEKLPRDAYVVDHWETMGGEPIQGVPSAPNNTYVAVLKGQGKYSGTFRWNTYVREVTNDYRTLDEESSSATIDIERSDYMNGVTVVYPFTAPADGTYLFAAQPGAGFGMPALTLHGNVYLSYSSKLVASPLPSVSSGDAAASLTCELSAGQTVYLSVWTPAPQKGSHCDIHVSAVSANDISQALVGVKGDAFILANGEVNLPLLEVSLGTKKLSAEDWEFAGWLTPDWEPIEGTPSDDGYYRAVLKGKGDYAGECTAYIFLQDKSFSFSAHPTDVSAVLGDMAVFNVSVNDESTVTSYRWQWRNHEWDAWTNCTAASGSGWDSASLTVKMNAARDGRMFRCVITDAQGRTRASDAATLTLGKSANSIEISSQPCNAYAEANTEATFEIGAEGGIGKLSFQWQWSRIGGEDRWIDCTAATGTGYNEASLEVVAYEARAGRKFRCIVTDELGNKRVSNTVTLVIPTEEKLQIISQPSDTSARKGELASFNVSVKGGTGEYRYRWQWRIDASAKWANCTAATGEGYNADTLVTLMNTAKDGRQFRCIVSDGSKSVASDIVTLSLDTSAAEPLVIASNPNDAVAAKNETVSFAITVSGGQGNVSYQWEWRQSDSNKWANCTAASGEGWNGNTLVVKAYLARDGRQFRCVATDAAGTKVTSETATLHVEK